MCAVQMSTSSRPSGAAATLRRVRIQVEMSAAELARLAGVAPNTVLNAERGTLPSPEHRRAISAALSIAVQQRKTAAEKAVTRARVDLASAEKWLDQMTTVEDPEAIWFEEAAA